MLTQSICLMAGIYDTYMDTYMTTVWSSATMWLCLGQATDYITWPSSKPGTRFQHSTVFFQWLSISLYAICAPISESSAIVPIWQDPAKHVCGHTLQFQTMLWHNLCSAIQSGKKSVEEDIKGYWTLHQMQMNYILLKNIWFIYWSNY